MIGELPQRIRLGAALLGLVSLTLTSVSCRQRPAMVPQETIAIAPTRNETSPFEIAVRYLNSLDQYQPEQVRLEILSNLREWARQEKDDVEWIADPMFRRLPQDLKRNFTIEQLGTNEFQQHDSFELQEAVWLRDVAKSVAAQSLYEPEMAQWLEQQIADEQITRAEADDLSLAYRLFDWTVRNLQLDSERDPRDILQDAEVGPETLRHVYYPYENLLYGHGDWLERSRLFILLCRQLGIPSVMLVADRGDDVAQPWVPATLIGSSLYLFDPLLGLPIPGKPGQLLTRLDDLVQQPELIDDLRQQVPGYRISRSDLGQLIAAVDATPAALSQRMKQIESRLTGDRKMVLTVTPTPLSLQLEKNPHVQRVEIWTLPYRGYAFLAQLSQSPERGVMLLRELQEERLPFETRSTVRQGRLLHLRGYFRGDPDVPGATQQYMDSRASKKQLMAFSIPYESVPKNSPMLANLPADGAKAAYEQRMAAARNLALTSKELATHWLGLVAFEKHDFRVAADYFRRVVAEDPPHRFKQSANYNLARALEALGQQRRQREPIIEAIQLYESDTQSPQAGGNQLRARRLAAADE